MHIHILFLVFALGLKMSRAAPADMEKVDKIDHMTALHIESD